MDADQQIEGFIDRYDPRIAAHIRAARSGMRQRLPGATELVYDNYNALVFAYGASERASHIVFSIAAYPRWVSLFFAGGVRLDDPKGLLKGEGMHVRHIVLDAPERLDDPDVAALMVQALARAIPPIDPARPARSLLKSVSARQRPRRPGSS